MNNILDIIIYYINRFYDWLYSYSTWTRNAIFLLILMLPAFGFWTFADQDTMMSAPMATLYVIYLLALIIGFVQREEQMKDD